MMKRIPVIFLLFLLLLTRCEKIADEAWTLKLYGDAREDIGYSIAIASDGYLIAGQYEELYRNSGAIVEDSANKNLVVIKTNWDGNVVWEKTFGGKGDDYGMKLYQNTDASLMCVGTNSVPGSGKDVFVVKLSAGGDLIWKKTFGGSGNQIGKDILKTPGGYIILASTDMERSVSDSTGNIQGNTDFLLINITDNGDLIDQPIPYGYPGNDDPAVIKYESEGKYIVVGTTEQSWPGQSQRNLLLVRFNSSGDNIGNRIIGGVEDEYAADMEVLADGYVIAGTVGNPSTIQQAYITKIRRYNEFGGENGFYKEPLFTNKFRINDVSTAIRTLTTMGTDDFIAGGYNGSSPGSKMMVFAFDGQGVTLDGKLMITGGGGDLAINDVVAGDDDFILALGSSRYETNTMIALFKFKF